MTLHAYQKRALAGFIVILCLSIGGLYIYTRFFAQPDPAELAGQLPEDDTPVKAEDFTVYDALGNATKLSDHLGKPVVINFWASYSAPCQWELPEFNLAWREWGDEVTFMIINATDGKRETQKDGVDFLQKKGYGFPVYYDLDQEAITAFNTHAYPATFFIDEYGYYVAMAKGALEGATIQEGIQLTLQMSEERAALFGAGAKAETGVDSDPAAVADAS